MMPYMRNGTQSGLRKVTNSKKSNPILGEGNKIIDVEKVKMLSAD